MFTYEISNWMVCLNGAEGPLIGLHAQYEYKGNKRENKQIVVSVPLCS